MPGLPPSDLAQQIDVDRLRAQVGEHDSRLQRDEVLIRPLQAKVRALEVALQPNRVLDLQRLWSAGGGFRTASFNGTVTYHVCELTSVLGNPSMQIQFSSTVAFWWECLHTNGLIRKDDVAYHYIYSGLRLAPADLDGLTVVQSITTQHGTANQFGALTTRRIFRCAANTFYTVQAILGAGSGGTWNYSKDVGCYLEAKAWAQ